MDLTAHPAPDECKSPSCFHAEPYAKELPAPDDGHGVPILDHSTDIELVTRLLDRSYRCNGVCNEKILLWGRHGCGKRRIATQAALNFAAKSGCKILWVEGRSFETFIRDYREAYTTVTGDRLPQGLPLGSVLLKIMTTLEKRRQEWLMVIFDLQPFLEDEGDSDHLTAPTSFLPEWCRVVVTSSSMMVNTGGRHMPLMSGLRFAQRASCFHVVGFDEEKTVRYFKLSALDSFDLDFRELLDDILADTISPLNLALSCASMRLLKISPKQFCRVRLQRSKEDSLTSRWMGGSINFTHIMAVLWDALNDYDVVAARILAICSIVDPLDIPMILLARFPMFREDTYGERFSAAINVLRRSSLVEVRHKRGLDTVNIPLQVYQWLQFNLRHLEDDWEYRDLVHGWVTIFTDYLTLPRRDVPYDSSVFSAEKFWPVAAHVASLCNLKTAQVRSLRSFEYMAFLKHVAILLVDDGIFVTLAGVTITHAFNMFMLLQSRRDASHDLDREYVHIRQIRAMAFLKVSEFRQAESELREAKQIYHRRLATDPLSKHTIRQIQDAEAHLHVIQGKYPEAYRLLSELLTTPEPDADPFKIAQRHYWMSIYKTAVDEDISALEHSHMTMTYWKDLAVEEKWGLKDFRRLHWVEKHILALMCMRKYKGALALGSKLLERFHDMNPVLNPAISRLAYRVVYCFCALDKVNEAEKIACQLLEMPSHGKFEDETWSYLLHMLHELGEAFQRNGRTVEAEGVFRFNLKTARQSRVRNLANTGLYDTTSDWVQLTMCLLEQGKTLEARDVRVEHQTDSTTKEFMNDATRDSMGAYRHLKYLYSRTMEAENSGTVMEWRAIVDQTGNRPGLKRAVKMFGHPRRRIERDRDFESDVDIHNVRRARNSRLLRALNFPLIYLSFVNTSPDCLPEEQLWASRSQSVLGQYWMWCECKRKRSRSQSIDPRETFSLGDRDPCPTVVQKKALKQRLISDWTVRTPPRGSAVARPEGCTDSCPCIPANQSGPAESKALESNLILWSDPSWESSPTSASKTPKQRPRYRNATPNRSPIPENEMFTLIRPNHWWWVQSEFANGEGEGENYIIPRAVDIPGISITPPEGQTELLPMAVDTQNKLSKFYKPDYAAEFAKVLEEEEKGRPHIPTRLDDILEDEEDEENA